MEKIKVDKERLIEVLQKNKRQHEADYRSALTGYRISMKKALSKKMKELKNSTDEELAKLNFCVNTVKPESHTADFDTVLGMLQVSTDDEIWITANEYKQYFMNDWSWKSDWYFSNAGNIGIGRAYVDTKK